MMLKRLLNYIIPATCPGCHLPIEQDHSICPKCWTSLVFITDPFCNTCAEPLEISTLSDDVYICGSCLKTPPLFSQSRSLFKYSGLARQLILSLKHGGATFLSPTLGKMMAQHHQNYIKECDMIVPVPLHWSRLLKRGYNQAALLAKDIARRSDMDFSPTLLIRKKRTPSQGKYGKVGRLKNVKFAFSVPINSVPILTNKTVLLVDDVVASGATLNECTKVLLTAGAKKVKVLVVAKSTLKI